MSPKVRRRKESGLKIQEALIETHTQALSSADEKETKKLKKKIERATIVVENTRKNLRWVSIPIFLNVEKINSNPTSHVPEKRRNVQL